MPINVYVQMPSCVPAAPGLETAGASIDENDVAEAMGWPNIIGLGEMMNFPGVAHNDKKMMAEIAATQRAGKTVGGHYASLDLGRPFWAYVAGGPADDHEGTRAEDAIARVRLGMRAMLRFGSAWYDVAPQVKAITESGLDSRNFILCTDDRFAGTLIRDGHVDHAVRHAIEHGLKPMTAIQMASLNTATHFGLERELGSITPGRRADLIITSDIAKLPMEMVMAHGVVLAENGLLIHDIEPWRLSRLRARHREGRPHDRARRLQDHSARGQERRHRPRHRHRREPGADPRARAHPRRHRRPRRPPTARRTSRRSRWSSGTRARAAWSTRFVSGFGYTVDCAVASTVAHDSHQMIVVGTNRDDMALAANRLQEVGGGIVVISKGKELALIELPIAGLMSDERAEIVAAKSDRVVAAMAECGCTLNNAVMQHMFLALPVIPELRVTDLGVVDVRTFERVDLFV